MAYQFSNAAREISVVKLISARSLLMVLASAVDKKTGTCFHSAGCLMHWSGLSKGTFYTAVGELEKHGILKRQRRRNGNHTNLWTLDIKKMESLRVSWQDIKPKDAAPEPQDDPDGDSGMGLPPKAESFSDSEQEKVDEAMLSTWTTMVNRRFGFEPGTDAFWTLSKAQAIVDEAAGDFDRVREVVETLAEACQDGRIQEYFPKVKADGKLHMGYGSFIGKWRICSDAYDRVHSARAASVWDIEE